MAWSAVEFRQLLHKARPSFEPILRDLLTQRVCVRCCLRFAGVRSLGTNLHVLQRQPPPAAELLSALQQPIATPAALPTTDGTNEENGLTARQTPAATEQADVQDSGTASAQLPADFICSACVGVLQSPEGTLAAELPPAIFSGAVSEAGTSARRSPSEMWFNGRGC